MKRVLALSSMICFVALIAGCGSNRPQPAAVSGTVTYNNAPVSDAVITFRASSDSAGFSASGKTNTQGEFQLTTFKTNDGAVPGNYIITIEKMGATAAASTNMDSEDPSAAYGEMMDAAATGDQAKLGESSLPADYADPAKSGLQRTVVAGQANVFEFNLD